MSASRITGRDLYPYPPGAALYQLLRDGVPMHCGTEQECWAYIHRQHGFSVSHALKYEGYVMRPWE